MSKRERVLQAVKIAGYHEDRATGTRLLIEGRISMQSYNEAFNAGRRARAAGVRCECLDCQTERRSVQVAIADKGAE